jgi:hypothetical protein
MNSIVRFECGCIGLKEPLEYNEPPEPSIHVIFYTCNGDYHETAFRFCEQSIKYPEKATPLSREEIDMLMFDITQLIQDGDALRTIKLILQPRKGE